MSKGRCPLVKVLLQVQMGEQIEAGLKYCKFLHLPMTAARDLEVVIYPLPKAAPYLWETSVFLVMMMADY